MLKMKKGECLWRKRQKRWTEYFDKSINMEYHWDTVVTYMGERKGGKWVYEQSNIERREVVGAILMCEKASGIDGIATEI